MDININSMTITNILNSNLDITLIIGAEPNEEHIIQYMKTHLDELVITLNDNYQYNDNYHLLINFNNIHDWNSIHMLRNKFTNIIFDYSVCKFVDHSQFDTIKELYNMLKSNGRLYLPGYDISLNVGISEIKRTYLDFIDERYPDLDYNIKEVLKKIQFYINVSPLYGNHNINKGGLLFDILNYRELETMRYDLGVSESVNTIRHQYIVPVLNNKNKIYFINTIISYYNFNNIKEIFYYPLQNKYLDKGPYIVITK